MKESLEIGSAPPTETCAQVGSHDYYARARRECRAFINLLRRTLGPEPIGARLCLKSNPHDFGTYLSVVCEFDEGTASQWIMPIDARLRVPGNGMTKLAANWRHPPPPGAEAAGTTKELS